MASNPIVRRARQSFFIGFLIALVIMAVVVVFLFMKINALNEEKEALVVHEITAYILIDSVKSGDEVTPSMLVEKTIKAEIDVGTYMTPYDFDVDEETGEPLKYFAKIDIEAGTMITEGMLYTEGGLTAPDERLVEYNMIVLPSQLNNGDYVDIRIQMPGGQEYIVLAKKRIEQCTAEAIWMKMSEIDILTMNSAIVDTYRTRGATLRARVYTEPGMQEAAKANYAVSHDILMAINADKNVLTEAIEELVTMWRVDSDPNTAASDLTEQRELIDSYLAGLTDIEKTTAIETGVTTEVTNIATMRNDYVSALEGTGIVGTNY